MLGYLDAELVGHAVVTTRWLQPSGLPVLRTAYVDAVSTLPRYQRLGYGSAVMRHLTTVIPDYAIAYKPSESPFMHESGRRSGVGLWLGAKMTGPLC